MTATAVLQATVISGGGGGGGGGMRRRGNAWDAALHGPFNGQWMAKNKTTKVFQKKRLFLGFSFSKFLHREFETN
jgi:hypothetical protein